MAGYSFWAVAPYWGLSLALVAWRQAPSSGHCLISLSEWKSVLLNPCMTTPAIKVSLFWRLLEDKGVGGKRS